MILIIFILNLILADEIKLNFIDRNYDTKIEIDSLNIINPDYGIDTTLINPKSVDLKNLLIINSVELKNFGVVYTNNILKITSKEIINHIEIIDLLGKKVFEENPNSYNYEKNISLNKKLSFIILTIGNKRYSQKLYNVNQEIYQSPSILLSSKDKWQFTPYKDKYRDTTYIFTDDMLQCDSLDIELKRERYFVRISFNLKNTNYSKKINKMDPATHEKYDTNYSKILDIKDVIAFKLFEDKNIENSGLFEQCGYYFDDYFKSGFTNITITEDYEPTIYTFNVNFEDDNITEIFYHRYYMYRSSTYASSCDIKSINVNLSESLPLEDKNIEFNLKSFSDFSYRIHNDYNASYEFIDEFTSKYKSKTENNDEIILNFSIEKLD